MANGYARFFKADLHMQTPVDRAHWRGDALPADASPDQLAQVAEAYIARCSEVGLQLVGITEHNFAKEADQSLIPHLERAARSLADEGGPSITIFPGFEVTGPIGSGAHLICLFEPGTSMTNIDAKLTALGLPPNARFGENGAPLPVPTGDMTFKRMLEIVQDDLSIPGICFGAHPNDAGVLDRNTVEQWWSQEVIKNPHFLAIELPRPRYEFEDAPGSPLIKSILQNSDSRYERRHPIAAICCSDTKALTPDQENETNYIGFRYCWLKMSEPSIEGIRQAFLDHESRIRFGDDPEQGYVHNRVRRIRVSGAAFVDDQEINFSPNMNTLIGGGGTGKSTLIEYLRKVLGQDGEIYGSDAQANFRKIMLSIGSTTLIEIDVDREGDSWTLQSVGSANAAIVSGEDVPNFEKFFPVRFFSQREIYAIAESREARANLIDNLIRGDLDELERRTEDVNREISDVRQGIDERDELERRLRDLESERRDFLGKLTNLKRLDEPLARWRGFIAERDQLQRLEGLRDSLDSTLRSYIESLREAADAVASEKEGWPNAAAFVELETEVAAAIETLGEELGKSLTTFEDALARALTAPAVQQWRSDYDAAETAYETLREELIGEGADPEQYLAYERAARDRETEINAVQARLEELKGLRDQLAALVSSLRELWRQQTLRRTEKAASLEAAVPQTSADTPFVTVSVRPHGDDQAFQEQMGAFLKDRRRISDEDWRALLMAAVEATEEGGSPVDTLTSWMQELRDGTRPAEYPWERDDRRTATLSEWCNERSCEDIALIRVPDRVTISLFRDDGTYAGELEEGLSVGQKSTAILTLLLADDDAPAVIDQPEDELDNEFTYRELVPLLRSVKEKRQLIIATHDPNIPVNGDAELIYALEARGGRGVLKEIDGAPAAGALDVSAVRLAVETIMEGSEEAFRRRFEKYGF